MVFDLNAMKNDIVNKLKADLCPENTIGGTDFDLNKIYDYELAQSFIPFSTAWRSSRRSFSVDISMKKTGNPSDSIEVWLYDTYNGVPNNAITGRTLPPSSIETSYSDVRFWFDLSDIGKEYYLDTKGTFWFYVQTGGTIVDDSNYYSVERNTVDTEYWMGSLYYRQEGSVTWNALEADMKFSASLPTWVYANYPREDINLFSYPRIAVDVLGRPNVTTRWIDHRLADYTINMGITIYSRYPDELDDLLSYTDRSLWQSRTSMDTFRITRPGKFSSTKEVREGIFTRTMIYQGTYRETATN